MTNLKEENEMKRFTVITNDNPDMTPPVRPALDVIVNERLKRREDVLGGKVDLALLIPDDIVNVIEGFEELNDSVAELFELMEVKEMIDGFLGELDGFMDKR